MAVCLFNTILWYLSDKKLSVSFKRRNFLLGTRYSLLFTRHSLLFTRYSLLFTRYSLFFIRYFLLLLVTRCFLFVTRCFLLVTRYFLLVIMNKASFYIMSYAYFCHFDKSLWSSSDHLLNILHLVLTTSVKDLNLRDPI